ncbi:MAG: DUF4855 domain-containing protein [Limnochordales bacterium]|nr:DUF4855 domain-containing protein [Limnochordales bacterium]
MLAVASAATLPAGYWTTAAETVLVAYTREKNLSPDEFVPFLTYVDREGRPRAPFFDGFIMTPTIQTFAGWEENLFRSGIMLSAVDEAAGRVARLFPGLPPFRVYVAIANLEGATGEERAQNARHFIDNVRRRFAAAGYKHIQLAGFYWHQEGLRDPVSYEAARLTAGYLHSLAGSPPLEQPRLQLLWIPYDFGHPNRPQVRDWAQGNLPLDAVWLQPNFLWAERSGYDKQDLDETARFAQSQGVPIEIEFDGGVFTTGWKASRYHHYLVSGLTYGYIALPLTYYEGAGALLSAARSPLSFLRQLYEETYAFARNHYVPRSFILGGRWLGPGSEHFEAARSLQFLADAFLPLGLWLGRTDKPEAVQSLRLVEPDPNQSYWLVLTFRAGASPESQAEGVITITTQDGDSVEIGRYPLDGELHTRWYTIPGELLRQGVPPVPTSRLVYPIHFSTPVELHASWLRSDQWVMRWDAQAARFWDSVDPEAFVAQEGRLLPGVRFDAATNRVHWSGMDDSQPLLVSIETTSGWSRVYTLPPELTDGSGQGSFSLTDLPDDATVTSVYAQPVRLPFHTVFGAEGDTAAPWRRPGIALQPGEAWAFAGKPVGVTRKLVGQQGRILLSAPATGTPYRVLILFAGVTGNVRWSLQPAAAPTGKQDAPVSKAPLASGRLNPADTELSLLLSEAGNYELILEGGEVQLREAWLFPAADQVEPDIP